MLEILQSLSRAVLALLSGAMLVFATIFLVDWLSKVDVFDEVMMMLRSKDSLIVFTAIASVIAYGIGVINLAGSDLLFGFIVKTIFKISRNDLLLIGQIESLNRPQLLKETMDLLHVKRTLIGLTIPLILLGCGLACDVKQWDLVGQGQSPGSSPQEVSHLAPRAAGLALVFAGLLAPYLALCMTRQLDPIANELTRDPSKR